MNKSYSELETFSELLNGYRKFKEYCEKIEKITIPISFTVMRSLVDLGHSTKIVVESCSNADYSEDQIEEIKSILDLAGHKFSTDKEISEYVEENLNLLEIL